MFIIGDLDENSSLHDKISDWAEKFNILVYKLGSFLREPSTYERDSMRSSRPIATLFEVTILLTMVFVSSAVFFLIVYFATTTETDQEKELRLLELTRHSECIDHTIPTSIVSDEWHGDSLKFRGEPHRFKHQI